MKKTDNYQQNIDENSDKNFESIGYDEPIDLLYSELVASKETPEQVIIYTDFTRRTELPTENDKYVKSYIREADGGWNLAIKGKPTHELCTVLSNCVGWAAGRYNEIYDEIKNITGHHYPYLVCNAEDFPVRAKKSYPDIIMDQTPEPGAIMVWEGIGSLAGHVAIVEEVIDNNTVYTSESGYGSTIPMRYQKRVNDNGCWGMNTTNYKFTCFMHNPAVEKTIINIVQPVERDVLIDQLYIDTPNYSYIRMDHSTASKAIGQFKQGYFNYTDSFIGDDYVWYKLAENQWVAKTGHIQVYPKVNPSIEKIELNEDYTNTYYAGDFLQFKMIGLNCKEYWNTGEVKDVVYNNYKIIPANGTALTVNDTKIIINFENNLTLELPLEIKVKVEPKVVKIQLSGTYKTEYWEGEKLDLTGLIVEAVYDNGEITSSIPYIASPQANSLLPFMGTQNVVIAAYLDNKGFSTSFKINVKHKQTAAEKFSQMIQALANFIRSLFNKK